MNARWQELEQTYAQVCSNPSATRTHRFGVAKLVEDELDGFESLLHRDMTYAQRLAVESEIHHLQSLLGRIGAETATSPDVASEFV